MGLSQRLRQDKTTRNKLLMTTGILFLLLIGYRIPLPGINTDYLKQMFSALSQSGAGSFLNALTGSSFTQMSVFALSIAPYISASIVIQLMTVFIPALERTAKDGSVGREKMEKLTYVMGIVIAFIQALAMSIGFGKRGLFTTYNAGMVIYATTVWTLGACFLTWVGQTITKKLIGNGISLILLFNILTTIPGDVQNIYNSVTYGESAATKVAAVMIMIVVAILVFAYVVILNQAEKRLKLINSSKSGKTMEGTNSSVMPIKLNLGGVMPIIFSSSLMSIIPIVTTLCKASPDSFWGKASMFLTQSNWFNIYHPIYTLGVLIFIPLTFIFAHFYTTISFNTTDIADNLKKSGSVIVGIRPGPSTEEYLKTQIKSMLGIGTTMLVIIALFPTLISGLFNIRGLSFGGTTILIIVGVIIEMKETLKAKTASTTYKKLFRKG